MNIDNQLQSVLKGITVPNLGQGILQPEKAAQFVQVLSAASPMLDNARRIDMNSPIRDIDRVGFAGRILMSGAEVTDPGDTSNPTFNSNRLIAQELVAIQSLSDSALEDNIAKGGFENTLIALLGDRAGFDLEDLFLHGDETSADAFIKVTNGWLKKVGHSIAGGTDFDDTNIEAMLEKMLLNVPQKYLRDRSQFTYYVPFKAENDYRNVLRAKYTALGDAAQSAFGQVAYKGIKIVTVPNMATGEAMLVQDDNLVYGIHRDIRIEDQRWARQRKTDFVLTLRADCHFENEDAVVKATGYVGV